MTTHTDPGDDMIRETIETTDLGAGLARLSTAWKGREAAGAPFELLGLSDGFALDLGDGRPPLELEIDRDFEEWRRRARLLWPDGEIDTSNSARRLVELAHMLRRDEVFLALVEWAAQDAAADGREGGA